MEIIESKNGTILVLNPNKKVVESIRKLIKQNTGHCPCNPLLNEDTVCPCREVREEGECRCGLYMNLLNE